MSIRSTLALLLVAVMCASASADEKYTLHENLSVDQKSRWQVIEDYHVKITETTNGKSEATDTQVRQSWKETQTVLAVKDGSATQLNVEVDADSFDTTKNAGEDETKAPCAFAGKAVKLKLLPDQTVVNDFKGDASSDDRAMLKGIIYSDAVFYPDHPIAVGDDWDISDKLSKISELGPKDKLTARCRLDSVKMIGGKQIAQITCSSATIQHNGNLEEDIEDSYTLTVDIAAGMISKSDETSTAKYQTPAGEAVQTTGGTEMHFHGEQLPLADTSSPTTKP